MEIYECEFICVVNFMVFCDSSLEGFIFGCKENRWMGRMIFEIVLLSIVLCECSIFGLIFMVNRNIDDVGFLLIGDFDCVIESILNMSSVCFVMFCI